MTTVANSNSNKLTRSKPKRNYWSPLTSLVDELEDDEKWYEPLAAFQIESKKEKALRIVPKIKEMNETERQIVGKEMASSVQDMEDKMNQMLAEFDQINESIDDLLAKSDTAVPCVEEEEEIPNGIFDTGATSGAAAEKDAKYLINTGEK